MMQFEYEITSYGAEVLQNREYFCSPDGECFKESAPAAENCEFQGIMNERGRHGWELVQLLIRDSTINAFWKRQIV